MKKLIFIVFVAMAMNSSASTGKPSADKFKSVAVCRVEKCLTGSVSNWCVYTNATVVLSLRACYEAEAATCSIATTNANTGAAMLLSEQTTTALALLKQQCQPIILP